MKGHVLIIEDNLETRELYRLALDGNGVDVHSCISAAEALDRLQTNPVGLPNLILCDYMMPGMDGGDFVQQIRRNTLWKQIRVILVSGIDNLKAVATSCGADDYLQKPFGLDELEAIVRNHLAQRA